MKRLLGWARAFAVVAVSMGLGVLCTFTYLTFSPATAQFGVATTERLLAVLPGRASVATGGAVPVRLEAPLSRDGEATKASLFDEQQVTDIYRRVAPAVVLIQSRVGQRAGLGSGVVIDPNGLVLTNYHVVRNATQIEVALSDHARYVGQVLGGDPQNDLAVVRLLDTPGDLAAAPLGDSAALEAGALAIAIGNPHGMERSVTVGVVSGLNRTLRDKPDSAPIRDVIQTDAAINQGNSGGPLLNSKGQIIGITTAIEVVGGQPGFGGIGYAVPVDTAKRYLARMEAGETIQHAWLGISGNDVTPSAVRERGLATSAGVLIADTVPGSPAEAAGVRSGDVITSLGGEPVKTMDDLGLALEKTHNPGDVVSLGVQRGKEALALKVTIGTWPDHLPPQR